MTTTSAGPSGLCLLPLHLISYIVRFIKYNYTANILLNMYKAFECIYPEADPLAEYKDAVQYRIVCHVRDSYIFRPHDDKTSFVTGLTNREIMYLFDCYYGDAQVIMYGEETYETIGDSSIVDTTRMIQIEHEFLDCSYLTELLAQPYMGIQFGLNDDLNISMYKYIRLLEEALRLKSPGLIAFIKKHLVMSPDMLLYIYIKHNHQVYAPDWYSLAADDLLLELCKEAGILPTVLRLAINGKRYAHVFTERALKNVVEYNLTVVQKIVPHYISASSAVLPYDDTIAANGEAARGR